MAGRLQASSLEALMKRIDLSLPEFLFIVATRGILGTGIGLLAAGRFRRNTRRYVGATLAAIGALTTIPAAFVVSRSGSAAKAKRTETA